MLKHLPKVPLPAPGGPKIKIERNCLLSCREFLQKRPKGNGSLFQFRSATSPDSILHWLKTSMGVRNCNTFLGQFLSKLSISLTVSSATASNRWQLGGFWDCYVPKISSFQKPPHEPVEICSLSALCYESALGIRWLDVRQVLQLCCRWILHYSLKCTTGTFGHTPLLVFFFG